MDETIDGNVTRASDFWTMGASLAIARADRAPHGRTAHDRSARGDTDTPPHFHHRSGGGGGAGQAGQGRLRRGHQVQGVAQDPPPRRPHPVPGPQGTCRGASPNRPRGCSRRARGSRVPPLSRVRTETRRRSRRTPLRGADKAPIGRLGFHNVPARKGALPVGIRSRVCVDLNEQTVCEKMFFFERRDVQTRLFWSSAARPGVSTSVDYSAID